MPTDKIKNIDNVKMDRIIRAAIREFAELPYQHASYNRIIRAAGLGKGTMYYYFRSKEDLFATITRGVEQGLVDCYRKQQQEAAIQGDLLTSIQYQRERGWPSPEFWSWLELQMSTVFTFASTQPLLFRFVRTNLLGRSGLPSVAQELRDRMKHQIKVRLMVGQSAGSVRNDIDLEFAIELMVAIFQTQCTFTNQLPHLLSPREQAEAMVDLLIRQLQPSSESKQSIASHHQGQKAQEGGEASYPGS